MVPTVRRFSEPMPRAMPTPSTAPTRVWVVEIGRPVPDASTTVVAAPSSAAKPRLGVRAVILVPTVAITRAPRIARPNTMPMAPTSRIQLGMAASSPTWPPLAITLFMAASGPTALATSLEPWAKAMAQAVKIINTAKMRSTEWKRKSLSASRSGWMRLRMLAPMTATSTPPTTAQPRLAAKVISRPICLRPLTRVTAVIT